MHTDDRYEAHVPCGLLNSSIYGRPFQTGTPGVHGDGRRQAARRTPDEAHGTVPKHTGVSKRTYNQTDIEELDVVQAEIDRVVQRVLSEGSAFPGTE